MGREIRKKLGPFALDGLALSRQIGRFMFLFHADCPKDALSPAPSCLMHEPARSIRGEEGARPQDGQDPRDHEEMRCFSDPAPV